MSLSNAEALLAKVASDSSSRDMSHGRTVSIKRRAISAIPER